MNIKEPQRYGMLLITMHWVMLFLLIAVYSCIELREIYPKGTEPREALKTWHFMLGLSVFFLVWIRIITRFIGETPSIKPPLPVFQLWLAKIVHITLYILMICMPIAGWMMLSAEGKDIPFFGLQLPALINENKELAETIEDVHETAGVIGYFIIALHTLAGLFHHYVQCDNTLHRMLPKFISDLMYPSKSRIK